MLDLPLSLSGALVAVALIAAWWVVGAWRARNALYTLFSIDPAEYRLVASDLGGRRPRPLRLHRLVGTPDAVFLRRDGTAGIDGEYKSREHRGHIRHRERYQTLLYCGMIKRKYRLAQVHGVLRFADEGVFVRFDSDCFERLFGLQDEYLDARRRWKAPNALPLHRRPSHRGA